MVLGGLGCLLWFCCYYFNTGGVASRALDMLGKCSTFNYTPNPPPLVLAANCRWGMLGTFIHLVSILMCPSLMYQTTTWFQTPVEDNSASFHVLVLWFWLLVNRKFNQIWLKKNEMFYFLAGDRVEDKETYDQDRMQETHPNSHTSLLYVWNILHRLIHLRS